ncbi:four helix bundle protein [Pinibacter aurantiacus]|uniref:Four helix bundle protein n=1 Tax=Pinibacter aurantiacus TaxID=2851599 RepID=A0A9E2S9B0_9BACT|nr:four helix bundle protein [Pinibacter aurantiacus]MBV4356994.1 four helix bundle protein [Pinibacter aurantiacus]
MSAYQFRDDLAQRTKLFAIRVVRLFRALSKTADAQIIGKQLLRSATSVAANYRAACRSRSFAEYHSKLSIVIEETDETMFWLEILWETNIVKQEVLQGLYLENEEILKIMSVARKNSKKS